MDNSYLFRGKRVGNYNKEWVYGCYLLLEDGHYIVAISTSGTRIFKVEPTSVCHCSGLSAAKSYRGENEADRLIFEHDIIIDEKGNVGRVAYLQQECGYVVVLPKRDYRLGHRNRGSAYSYDAGLEIVGTVFDESEAGK